MAEIHPSIYDIVPSVVKVVSRRFKGFVDESDLRQECYLFAASKYAQHKELLDEPNTEKRLQNERKIGWQIKRVAERYARKEKQLRPDIRQLMRHTTRPLPLHSYFHL